MALSFFHPLLRRLDADLGMSFLQDEASDQEVADALLGFVHDPLDPAVNSRRIDHFLDLDTSALLPDDEDEDLRCGKMPRGDADAWLYFSSAGNGGRHGALHWSNYHGGHQGQAQPAAAPPEFLTEFVMPLPAPLFVCGAAEADAKKAEGATNGCHQSGAKRGGEGSGGKRITKKTAELSRLVPGGHRLNTAEMLHEAGRHVRLLKAQVGVLALMRTIDQRQEEEEKMQQPSMAPEERIMHALLVSGCVQERLAAEGKCLVPRKLVDAMAEDIAVKSNAALSRDFSRFVDSLPVPEP